MSDDETIDTEEQARAAIAAAEKFYVERCPVGSGADRDLACNDCPPDVSAGCRAVRVAAFEAVRFFDGIDWKARADKAEADVAKLREQLASARAALMRGDRWNP